MAKMSKKTAEQIAKHINSCTVWARMTSEAIRVGQNAENYMKWHDDAGRELNALLGVDAIVMFNR